MVSTIRIEVMGLDETISKLNNITSQGLQQTKQNVLQQASDFMASEMRNNAHVITGNMRNSISNGVIGDQAIVSCTAEYAVYENRRAGSKAGYGPHNFADMAAQTTVYRAAQIAKQEYDNLFRSA